MTYSFDDLKKIHAIAAQYNLSVTNLDENTLRCILALEKKEEFPEYKPATTPVELVAQPEAKALPAPQPAITQAVQGNTYELWGRVTVTIDGSVDYSVVIRTESVRRAMKRTKFPTFAVSEKRCQDLFKLVSRKWNQNRDEFIVVTSKKVDGKMRGTYDTKGPIATGVVEWKGNEIDKIRTPKIKAEVVANPSNIPVAKKITPVAVAPKPQPAVTVTTGLGLTTFSITVDKHDPMFINDVMLQAYHYNPDGFNIVATKEILGRIGEVVFHHKYPNWNWNNQLANNAEHFDFVEPKTLTSLDIKTTNHLHNNLLIEQKKVELNKMSDQFALMVVQEQASKFVVSCLGFASKEFVLQWIGKFPGKLMGETYKIDRPYLKTEV